MAQDTTNIGTGTYSNNQPYAISYSIDIFLFTIALNQASIHAHRLGASHALGIGKDTIPYIAIAAIFIYAVYLVYASYQLYKEDADIQGSHAFKILLSTACIFTLLLTVNTLLTIHTLALIPLSHHYINLISAIGFMIATMALGYHMHQSVSVGEVKFSNESSLKDHTDIIDITESDTDVKNYQTIEISKKSIKKEIVVLFISLAVTILDIVYSKAFTHHHFKIGSMEIHRATHLACFLIQLLAALCIAGHFLMHKTRKKDRLNGKNKLATRSTNQTEPNNAANPNRFEPPLL
jgi:hypothetical protein